MAAKSKVASTSKKAAVKKATGKARGRPKGLQLNAAQARAYNKAFTATAQKLSQAASIRAFATGLRKYRLQAANSTVRAYNKARGNAQVAAIAAHAASQSLMQSRLGHQNAALLARIGQDAFRHTTLLGRMQFAQAGVKVYAHRAVMNTVTQKQAVSIETKFLSKVVKTAKKAGAKRGRPKGTPLSKSIGAAATAAGKAAAAKVPGTATTRATGKAGPKSARAVKANVKASSKASGASKKAPVKAAKTRTAPNFAAQAAAYGHALTAMWAGAPADGKALVKNYPSQRDWMGDEVTPNCIVTAIANHLLHARSVVASEKELKELDELAGPEPTIEEVLWQVYLTGWPGRAVHLGNYREVDDELETENLVIGFEVRTDDGWADHCALALNDCRVVSWGSETDRESLVEEAWELTWLVLERAGIAVVVAAAAVVLIATYHRWQPWMAVHTGSAAGQESGSAYAYWSGFGSVFPWEVGFILGTLTFAYQHGKKVNCHTHKCWRIGSYPVDDYKVCKRCHHLITGTHPTIEHLQDVHAASLEVADNQDEPGASGTAFTGCGPGCAGPSAPAS